MYVAVEDVTRRDENKIDNRVSYILVNYIHHLFVYVAVEDVTRRDKNKK